jgi:hypothetical protein
MFRMVAESSGASFETPLMPLLRMRAGMGPERRFLPFLVTIISPNAVP